MAEETELVYDGTADNIQDAAKIAAAKVLADDNVPMNTEMKATIYMKKMQTVRSDYRVVFTP